MYLCRSQLKTYINENIKAIWQKSPLFSLPNLNSCFSPNTPPPMKGQYLYWCNGFQLLLFFKESLLTISLLFWPFSPSLQDHPMRTQMCSSATHLYKVLSRPYTVHQISPNFSVTFLHLAASISWFNFLTSISPFNLPNPKQFPEA